MRVALSMVIASMSVRSFWFLRKVHKTRAATIGATPVRTANSPQLSLKMSLALDVFDLGRRHASDAAKKLVGIDTVGEHRGHEGAGGDTPTNTSKSASGKFGSAAAIARNAPISYTAPVMPPPAQTSAVLPGAPASGPGDSPM